MKKFEYKVVPIGVSFTLGKKFETVAQQIESKLNELGNDGWELTHSIDGFYFFKRDVP